MSRSFLTTAPILAALAGASPASAHAFLVRAVPPVGATVRVAPPTLDLFYTEGVVPRFTRVQVLDPHGKPVSTGNPRLAADDKRELIVGLPKLQPGAYEVVWHATSVDTHKTEGRFRFQVAP
jgi:methionine-rich copper-binding protein CopC